jgi:hypothetical protein
VARLRPAEPANAAPERPLWLSQFRWQDWHEPGNPLPAAAGVFNAGTAPDPAEVAWLRQVLAARHRWNAAREKWFHEHGQGGNFYRVRLTGKTCDDIED